MNFDLIFFDLDATLYPESNGLWPAIRERIDLYMRQQMGFDPAEIARLREDYYLNHGTTLCGLRKFHQVDPVDYLNFVHDLPVHRYLHPDPALRTMLLSMPQRRWVFTNSDSPHANRVMQALGITDCFEGMIDVLRLEPDCKPNLPAYQKALHLVGDPDPSRCALLDDSTRNLATAKDLGIYTVLVGHNGDHPDADHCPADNCPADRCLTDIHALPTVVPEFWDSKP